jgi:hypoxanthine phosphoribosyltransferase
MTRLEPAPSTPEPQAAEPATAPSTAFAHASEAEFARILDFYGVRWEYEPHTFPIRWNLDGGVAESFSPDFWLPDLELYVELTTLRQSLVRKKNRKLRRLRELYPDLRVKLFYGRDFRALMLKYGKLGLVDGLSGALGQSTLGRPVEASPIDVAEAPLVAGRSVSLAAGLGAGEAAHPAAATGMATKRPIGNVGGSPPAVERPAVEPPTIDSSGPETAQPAGPVSRSARRRRRRAAALLDRRTHPQQPSSQPAPRHDPAKRR